MTASVPAASDIYRRKLNVVDGFEAKVGEREAILRSRDFMVAYLIKATKPLPASAAHALRVAIEYKNSVTSLAELQTEQQTMATWLSAHGGWTFDDPECCAFKALHAVLGLYIEPSWGGGAGEVVSNFWELMKKFDRNEDLLLRLLKEHFPE